MTTPSPNWQKFLDCKGQFLKVCFETTKNPAARFKGTILRKRTSGVFRAGVDFAKLRAVEEGIAEGTRGPVQGLAWGEWLHFPYIIRHTGKGTIYLRLYPVPNNYPEVSYTVNGASVDKDTFNSYLTPSDAKGSDEPLLCFSVNAENIISIG